MAEVKVCLWNIQNYGQAAKRYDGNNPVSSNGLRNQFIARLMRQLDIDVLMIQETQTSVRQSLIDLQQRLNAVHAPTDWAYSACGSAIAKRTVEEAKTPGDLTMMSGARTEGYAIAWRRNQSTRFSLVDGVYPIATVTGPRTAHLTSPLNISQYGRPTGNMEESDKKKTFGATGGYLSSGTYPYNYNEETKEYDEQKEWAKLNYSPTAKSAPKRLQWEKVRRPAYVVMKLGKVDADLCPVAVYHAPSNADRSSWAAFIAGLSREVYVTNKVAGVVPDKIDYQALKKTIFGGDFNNSVKTSDWPGDYRYFTAGRVKTYLGGAACEVAPPSDASDADRRTTVQIVKGEDHDDPINSANTNDYLFHKIDLLFSFSDKALAAQRIDLLNEIIDSNAYDLSIKAARAMMRDIERTVGKDKTKKKLRLTETGPEEFRRTKKKGNWVEKWVPIICGSWGGTFLDWEESCKQFETGTITDARRAAEFIHLFVSDHLPLVATVTI